jgi:hypothetical protein
MWSRKKQKRKRVLALTVGHQEVALEEPQGMLQEEAKEVEISKVK